MKVEWILTLVKINSGKNQLFSLYNFLKNSMDSNQLTLAIKIQTYQYQHHYLLINFKNYQKINRLIKFKLILNNKNYLNKF